MRMSQLFGKTLRQDPSEAEVTSHKLLLRAGYIRQIGAGIFSYLHLAQRSLMKIQTILRDEMERIGGQEISMPVVQPADPWKETGRFFRIGSEMGRFKDKNNHDMVLAMTHEEIVATLVRNEIQSYKDLPRLIYHIQTKWRDDPRPRAGLIRVREFTMKDSYSLDYDWSGLDRQYQAHYQAYFRIFNRCGLPVIAVKSDVGMMGGKEAHEFMYLTDIGEDTLILCPNCGYTANRQIAQFKKPVPEPETQKPIQKVFTPNIKTIEELSAYLSIPQSKTAKVVFMSASFYDRPEPKMIMAVVRGDMEVNETKLANLLHAGDLRPATEEEIISIGTVAGFASPIGQENAIVVVDDLIPFCSNLVGGANEADYHLLNINFGRDFSSEFVGDIVSAAEGYPCPYCGMPLKSSRGVEVGNIFKLGTRYSDSLKCNFLDKDGVNKPVIMGSYGIGLGRLLACVAEEHHDDYGLCLPITIAPYSVYLVSMAGGEILSESLYQQLQSAGIDVLWDERDERPGVKFNDADLIGIPIRITVSSRSIEAGGVEFKRRTASEKIIVPLSDTISFVQNTLQELQSELLSTIK